MQALLRTQGDRDRSGGLTPSWRSASALRGSSRLLPADKVTDGLNVGAEQGEIFSNDSLTAIRCCAQKHVIKRFRGQVA